jgi:orotate phosphoribosyltransferase
VTREDIAELHGLMQSCLKHDGPYPLSSGLSSKYYYDGKLGTLRPPTAWLIGNVLLDVVLDSGAEAVGGPEIGAIPIADAIGLAAHLRGHVLPTFIVRKQAKSHGTRSQVAQAYVGETEDLLCPGRRVAIVDDVITTGGSIKQAIDVVEAMGCIVTAAIALVERHESDGKAFANAKYPVIRIFRTDEEGRLIIDEDFVRRAEQAAESSLSSGMTSLT